MNSIPEIILKGLQNIHLPLLINQRAKFNPKINKKTVILLALNKQNNFIKILFYFIKKRYTVVQWFSDLICRCVNFVQEYIQCCRMQEKKLYSFNIASHRSIHLSDASLPILYHFFPCICLLFYTLPCISL